MFTGGGEHSIYLLHLDWKSLPSLFTMRGTETHLIGHTDENILNMPRSTSVSHFISVYREDGSRSVFIHSSMAEDYVHPVEPVAVYNCLIQS